MIPAGPTRHRAAGRPEVLPRSGAAREALRRKGQFWTPDWIADFMVAYVLHDRPSEMLDPATGGGAFFRAASAMRRSTASRSLSSGGTWTRPFWSRRSRAAWGTRTWRTSRSGTSCSIRRSGNSSPLPRTRRTSATTDSPARRKPP
ncbi:MAG: N-6 DNA methylase [Armatimonadetes bacterium]|nr:N-6 DNA methylase [Armatimonadota bacterium]